MPPAQQAIAAKHSRTNEVMIKPIATALSGEVVCGDVREPDAMQTLAIGQAKRKP